MAKGVPSFQDHYNVQWSRESIALVTHLEDVFDLSLVSVLKYADLIYLKLLVKT